MNIIAWEFQLEGQKYLAEISDPTIICVKTKIRWTAQLFGTSTWVSCFRCCEKSAGVFCSFLLPRFPRSLIDKFILLELRLKRENKLNILFVLNITQSLWSHPQDNLFTVNKVNIFITIILNTICNNFCCCRSYSKSIRKVRWIYFMFYALRRVMLLFVNSLKEIDHPLTSFTGDEKHKLIFKYPNTSSWSYSWRGWNMSKCLLFAKKPWALLNFVGELFIIRFARRKYLLG